MNLRSRLAGRTNVTKTPPARALGAGFVRRTWTVPVGVPMGTRDVCPPGFSGLVVPTADAVREGMLEVDPEPYREGPPVVAVDLETTGGLGRSSIPFIVGAAWHDASSGAVLITQWTLQRPEAEAPMLLDALRSLGCGRESAGSRLLSFNGASFDLPVLRSRIERLGVGADLGSVRHVDLLTAARRLWRDRLPNCRLATLEAQVLRVRRIGDMDGAEVAEVFPQWLAAPNDPWALAQLERAQRHNRGDLVGLIALAAAVGHKLRSSEHPIEILRAAQHYARLGQDEQAWRRLEQLPAGLERPEILRDALRLRAELLRRRGDLAGAAEHWGRLCREHPHEGEAHDRLAKYLEHVVGDFEAALCVARGAPTPCPRRIARLERKRAQGPCAATSTVGRGRATPSPCVTQPPR